MRKRGSEIDVALRSMKEALTLPPDSGSHHTTCRPRSPAGAPPWLLSAVAFDLSDTGEEDRFLPLRLLKRSRGMPRQRCFLWDAPEAVEAESLASSANGERRSAPLSPFSDPASDAAGELKLWRGAAVGRKKARMLSGRNSPEKRLPRFPFSEKRRARLLLALASVR